MDIDRAVIVADDARIHDSERHRLASAKAHDATTLALLRTIPGIGTILSRVMLDDIQDIRRGPTQPTFWSSARVIRPGKESAGKRVGVGTGKQGTASLTWAFADAVGGPAGHPRHDTRDPPTGADIRPGHNQRHSGPSLGARRVVHAEAPAGL